jgi:hypothetical protein
MPVSPQFVINHRSALNGTLIEVKGIVVDIPKTTGTSPRQSNLPIANANPQPRIILADSNRKSRDRNYDLTVLIGEGKVSYALGDTVKVTGIVEASKTAVYLRSNQ